MHVIVGVTGGIAAYKATAIIRLLTEAGHTVKVIPTQNALRFVGATTLEALSHNSVDPDLYTDVDSVKHVALGQEADLVIVAPASASFLARYAAGIADDLLGNTLLVTKAPVVVAPAMHSEMWNHDATKENVAKLIERGVHVLQPATGRLTGADTGIGRLPEANEIVDFALSKLENSTRPLLGRRFLVTAGGTREEIDPVRFIGNRSSGKQGIAIALELQNRGADVQLIAANIASLPAEINDVVNVSSSEQLAKAVESDLRKFDGIVMAAAVADFRVANPAQTKIKRSEVGDVIEVKLIANQDILASVVETISKEKLQILTVGFAAETANGSDDLERLASKKLTQKKCDLIVANNVSNGMVFDADDNDVLILTKQGRAVSASGSKALVASEIVDVITDQLSK